MQTEEKSARFIRGIGPKRFEALNRLGVRSIRDLCYFFPRRYEDRSHFQSIADIKPGTEVTVQGDVATLGVRQVKQLTLFELILSDPTGTLTAVWFNQPYLKNQFKVGDRVILSGKAEAYHERIQLSSPEYERIQNEEMDAIHTGRITPIYPLSEGLAQRSLRTAMKEVADHYVSQEVKEFLPRSVRDRHSLMELSSAVQAMHFPPDQGTLEAARRRLIFDEFFIFELILLYKMRAIQRKERAMALQKNSKLISEFSRTLPFSLTEGQERAIQEILSDVTTETPMNRLLQGEVGSGKTVVAAFFLYLAAKSGVQSALLVPTEILAEQHYQTLSKLLSPLGVSCELLTGSLDDQKRAGTLERMESGTLRVIIGTHALLQEDIRFKQLGLVVIDEQHRFGVRQRAKLILRKPRPHLLVMTATPIPRTMGLTLYGDLDISTIKELPEHRKPIKTYWTTKTREAEVLEQIKKRVLDSEEQAYVLFPIIDESEQPSVQASSLSAATQEYERLRRGVFQGVPIGLVHGRLPKKDRDEVMQKFYTGKIKILVATSIVEVGVDNPNVTFIVIENAERFGLSQLHQMRGRAGRGEKGGTCFLFADPTTEEGKKRLRVLTKTTDGFEIAEADLKLRGPGEFLGTKQSGLPAFQLADLIRDTALLVLARKEAKAVLDDDPELLKPELQLLKNEMSLMKARFQPQ